MQDWGGGEKMETNKETKKKKIGIDCVMVCSSLVPCCAAARRFSQRSKVDTSSRYSQDVLVCVCACVLACVSVTSRAFIHLLVFGNFFCWG